MKNTSCECSLYAVFLSSLFIYSCVSIFLSLSRVPRSEIHIILLSTLFSNAVSLLLSLDNRFRVWKRFELHLRINDMDIMKTGDQSERELHETER
jgi:hypothetical protein